MSRRVRVLVADDSAFMRAAISRVLSTDPRLEVVGQAKDGQEAVTLAAELMPDVVTMDFNMPGMNGVDATRAILAARPTPIVMLSAHTQSGARETLQALAAGAVDFVTKPGGEVSPDLAQIKDQLVSKLLGAAGANLGIRSEPSPEALRESARRPAPAPSSTRSPGPGRVPAPGTRVVVIASSTGGPAALRRVVPSIRFEATAAVVVVQHMPAAFTAALAEQLSVGAALREARDGDLVEGGRGYVAPGDRHLVVERTGRLQLSDAPPVHGVRPAADVTLRSMAERFGSRVVGVVLTGMGRDGALGLAAVKAAGGRTIAQDRATSTVWGMPKAAVEMGVVDEVTGVDDIAHAINRWLG